MDEHGTPNGSSTVATVKPDTADAMEEAGDVKFFVRQGPALQVPEENGEMLSDHESSFAATRRRPHFPAPDVNVNWGKDRQMSFLALTKIRQMSKLRGVVSYGNRYDGRMGR